MVLLNKDLIIYELLSTTPLSTKLGVFFSLITGIGAMFSGIETILFSITVLLLSGNLVLFFSLLKRLRSLGTTSFTVGSSFIGFVVTGCASCQLTILSLATPLFSSTLVPLLGVRLQILSLILLVGSLLYNLKLSQKKLICKAS
ncbi:MAG TPA: hypothetical protein VJC10_00655 [Patescibacteria group bacterium]|nr:hypothetical protein [Patescibacteria group bacterium]